MRDGLGGYERGSRAEVRGGVHHRIHPDADAQRGGVVIHVHRCVGEGLRGGGGARRAGDGADGGVKGQAGGQGRGQGVGAGAVAVGGGRQGQRDDLVQEEEAVGDAGNGKGRGGVRLDGDAEHQRVLVAATGGAVRVAGRVGVHRRHGHGGGRAGQDAGGRVKGQAGDGRGQGVGDVAVAAGGRRQGQRLNREARGVGLGGSGRAAEARGGVQRDDAHDDVHHWVGGQGEQVVIVIVDGIEGHATRHLKVRRGVEGQGAVGDAEVTGVGAGQRYHRRLATCAHSGDEGNWRR